MSNYPGYPLPFSTWETFTPSLRNPFPVGGFHIPGLVPTVQSLTDPAFRPPAVDPLSSLSTGPHFSPGLSRYLLGANDIPALGLEPLYGFGPQESRGLLLSPSLSFSQNPSPLTFDQIYRSGASSVSPVSQYRRHFDDRGLTNRFTVPGRFSEPLRRDLPFTSNQTDSRDKCTVPLKSELSEKTEATGKNVKLWKPFEIDGQENTKNTKGEHSKLESSFSIEALTRYENKSKCNETVDANGNNVTKSLPENVKIWPEKPVPIRPVPAFSIACSGNQLCPGSEQSKYAESGLYPSVSSSGTYKSETHKPAKEELNIIHINSCDSSDSSNIDVTENNEHSEKLGLSKAIELGCAELDKEKCIVEKTNCDSGVSEGVDTKTETSSTNYKEENKSIFQDKPASSDTVVPYVQSEKERPKKVNVSLPKLELEIPPSLSNCTDTEPGSKQDEICSPPVNVKNIKTASPNKGKANKKNELLQLSIQVNEVRNRRNSKDIKLLSPTLSSPGSHRDICASDKVLSPPIETVSKVKKSSKVSERRRLSLPILERSAVPGRYLARMSSAEGAITMLKNTEDSLSASVSSSHLSESDSDTQLSNDHADKLFTESQSLNTQPPFSSPASANTGYMSTLGVDNMNHDNQYYKPNTPQLCQSESDNQKPYHCVQGQMFHDKPEVLPPYSCFSTNQSPNVLPREPGFHSQEENSNFPPSLSGVDSSMDYDENSVMSDSSQLRPPRCDSQSSISHGADSLPCKDAMLQSNTNVSNQEPYHLPEDEGTWDFLHSKQYIENIYGNQMGCEIVKSASEEMRESDSPKTFIDLDKTTKEKKAQETHKDKIKDGFGSKHYGKSSMRPGYPGMPRQGHGMYGNQSFDNYSHMAGNRWSSFNRNEGMMGNQSRPTPDGYSSAYDHSNQYRNSYQSNYPNMGQNQNGSDKPFNNQSGFHGNEYNQNDYYNQNPQMKNYQGNYGNARFDNGYYQNRGGNDFNSQNNVFPSNPSEMPGPRFPSQGYSGGQNNYSQHYGQQPPAHCGPDTPAPYAESTGFNIPRNASPASTGSDFGTMEAPGGIPKKKRGRKRKVDKEPPDENKPRPNTFVMAPTKIGPMIDIDNPESTIDTYDYNNQIETIFNFSIEDDLSPIGAQFLQIEQRLCQKLLPIKYGYPVTVIYSPLTYAFQTHRDFVVKYCTSDRTLLFLGMNPGPYGMSQNGVSCILLNYFSLRV